MQTLTEDEKAEVDRIKKLDSWNSWVFKHSNTLDGGDFAFKYRVTQLSDGRWGIVSRFKGGEISPYVSHLKNAIQAIYDEIRSQYGR